MRRDQHATLVDEMGGPVVLSASHSAHQGARAHTPREAILVAVSAALESALTQAQGCFPMLIVRVPRRYTQMFAGLQPETELQDPALEKMRTLWSQLQTRARVCLAGWQPDSGYLWGERSTMLAAASTATRWGPTPTTYLAIPRRSALPSADPDCPVCLEPLSDALPSFSDTSRAPNV